MKKGMILCLLLTSLISCNLISPKNVLVENNSKYVIIVEIENSDDKMEIKSGRGGFFLTYEKEVKIIVTIEEINYKCTIDVKIDYLEKKKLEFNLDNIESKD